MTQSIDPIKLKAAAEKLEWVLLQYPGDPHVSSVLEGLLPLIEKAKSGKIDAPLDRIPFAYNFADGAYLPYRDPSVEEAYANFSIEIAGGLSKAGEEIEARILAKKQARQRGLAS